MPEISYYNRSVRKWLRGSAALINQGEDATRTLQESVAFITPSRSSGPEIQAINGAYTCACAFGREATLRFVDYYSIAAPLIRRFRGH